MWHFGIEDTREGGGKIRFVFSAFVFACVRVWKNGFDMDKSENVNTALRTTTLAKCTHEPAMVNVQFYLNIFSN